MTKEDETYSILGGLEQTNQDGTRSEKGTTPEVDRSLRQRWGCRDVHYFLYSPTSAITRIASVTKQRRDNKQNSRNVSYLQQRKAKTLEISKLYILIFAVLIRP